MSRPNWDEYFIGIVKKIGERATCDRGKSGCVVVKENQILVTGYVGSASGAPHCDEVGHQFIKKLSQKGEVTEHCIRTVHAEQNAICQAAKLGISLNEGTLYCTMTPCYTCAKMIVNCGIKRVVCDKKYKDSEETEKLFALLGIELQVVYDEVEKYERS